MSGRVLEPGFLRRIRELMAAGRTVGQAVSWAASEARFRHGGADDGALADLAIRVGQALRAGDVDDQPREVRNLPPLPFLPSPVIGARGPLPVVPLPVVGPIDRGRVRALVREQFKRAALGGRATGGRVIGARCLCGHGQDSHLRQTALPGQAGAGRVLVGWVCTWADCPCEWYRPRTRVYAPPPEVSEGPAGAESQQSGAAAVALDPIETVLAAALAAGTTPGVTAMEAAFARALAPRSKGR